MAHTIVGTPYYLSPELCEEKPYNNKSDIWSLGCVLYELCTLRHPFEALNQGALALKILRANFNPIPAIYSKSLKDVVDKLLTKDYRQRPDIEQILRLDIMIEKMRFYGYEAPSTETLKHVSRLKGARVVAHRFSGGNNGFEQHPEAAKAQHPEAAKA